LSGFVQSVRLKGGEGHNSGLQAESGRKPNPLTRSNSVQLSQLRIDRYPKSPGDSEQRQFKAAFSVRKVTRKGGLEAGWGRLELESYINPGSGMAPGFLAPNGGLLARWGLLDPLFEGRVVAALHPCNQPSWIRKRYGVNGG
jgi:hypothetical protein